MEFDNVIDRKNTGSLKWDKYKGKDILPFWVADMDFKSSTDIIDALHDRIDHGVFGYTLPPESCSDAVVDYLNEAHEYRIKKEWLIWTPGLVPAINLACRAYAKPGDGIMTFTPVYYPFLSAPVYADQELQAVPLLLDEVQEKWLIDFDALEKKVTPSSQIFILSNPHNPVGRVFERDELEELGQFIVKHDLILLSDEIHCDLILNEKKHVCAGTLSKEIVDRTVIMMSPSKTYNLAGLSCAYLVIPNLAIRNRFKEVIRGIITEVNCIGYAGCEAAYTKGKQWHQGLIEYLEGNRDYLYQRIEDEFEDIKLYPMDATYLAWLDVRALKIENPVALFERFGAGLSEGSGFQGDGFLRLNFGCSREQLKEGLDRMKRAIDSISGSL